MEAVPNEHPVDTEPDWDPTTPEADDGPGLPPPTAVESLVNALLDAGPDVAEHVVRATQELLLAVQAIVDAAERAVDEQRDLRPAGEEPGAAAPPNVHPLDRTE
jgi:hypothetical protein